MRTTGQRWAADGCRTAVTCSLPSRLPTWSPVMTVRLSAGRHRIELGQTCFEPGAGPELERLALQPPSWEEPIAEPPATAPCQPPSSPVVPDPCAGR